MKKSIICVALSVILLLSYSGLALADSLELEQFVPAPTGERMIVSAPVSYDARNDFFEQLYSVAGILEVIFEESGINVANLIIGEPFRVHTDDQSEITIFPILHMGEAVKTVKSYYYEGHYYLSISTNYTMQLNSNQRTLGFFKTDGVIYSMSEEGIEIVQAPFLMEIEELIEKIASETTSWDVIENAANERNQESSTNILDTLVDFSIVSEITPFSFGGIGHNARLLSAPFVLQGRPRTCWAAASSSIIRFHGRGTITPNAICNRIHRTCGASCRGGHLHEVIYALENVGNLTTPGGFARPTSTSVNLIRTEIFAGRPMYVSMERPGEYHGMVLDGFSQHTTNPSDAWVRVVDNRAAPQAQIEFSRLNTSDGHFSAAGFPQVRGYLNVSR